MYEYDYVNKVCKYLQKFFYIKREVWSKCRKHRIDLVIWNKQKQDLVFGIEVKNQVRQMRGITIGEWLIQSIQYSKCHFPFNGHVNRIPILIVPPITYTYFQEVPDNTDVIRFHEKSHEHNNVNSMIGAFKVGEIRSFKDKNGFAYKFIFRNHTCWQVRQYKEKIFEDFNRRYYEQWLNVIRK